MIKTVLFDWDGTLVNSLSLWLDSCSRVFSDYGIIVSDKEFKKAFFSSSNSIEYLAGDRYQEISEVLFEQVDDWMENIKLNDGVYKILEELTQDGLSINLVTSSFGPTVERALVNSGANGFFNRVWGFEDVTEHKPDPEIIFKAMEGLGNNKDETIIVGDSDNDIISGRRAGIKTCFYYPKQNEEFYNLSEEKLAEIGPTIRSFDEIWEILE